MTQITLSSYWSVKKKMQLTAKPTANNFGQIALVFFFFKASRPEILLF